MKRCVGQDCGKFEEVIAPSTQLTLYSSCLHVTIEPLHNTLIQYLFKILYVKSVLKTSLICGIHKLYNKHDKLQNYSVN